MDAEFQPVNTDGEESFPLGKQCSFRSWVTYKHRRKDSVIFPNQSDLGAAGTWSVNGFSMWNLFKAPPVLNQGKLSYWLQMSWNMWFGSRSVRAVHALVYPNEHLIERSQGLLYQCDRHCLGRSDAVWRKKSGFVVKWIGISNPISFQSGIGMKSVICCVCIYLLYVTAQEDLCLDKLFSCECRVNTTCLHKYLLH